MSARTLAYIALFLWLLTVIAVAIVFVRGRTAPAPDGRTSVLLTAPERDTVLMEMRGLLQSTQGIVHGIASGDRAQIATAAQASGMAAAVDVSPALMAKLPLDFKRLGLGTHRAFDEIAREAAAGASNQRILQLLDGQLGRCTACHATYRLSP